MKTTKKTSITTNSHQLKDSSRWSQPVSLIGIDHSRLNPLMAISPILIFAFLLPLSFNLLTSATALAVAPTIGLSILATDGNTNNNITIQSPSGGGIAVGRHTLVVNTNSYKGYTVNLNSSSAGADGNKLINVSNPTKSINPVTGTLSAPAPLASNTWGVAVPGKTGFNQNSDYVATNTDAKYAAVPVNGDTVTANNSVLVKDSPSAAAGDKQVLVYGVNASGMLTAGNYQATVTYTAVTQMPSAPTISSITPDSYQLGTTDTNASKITIAGTDLGSTNEVYIDLNGNGQQDSGEECTNLTIQSDNSITCNVPTTDVNAGTYDVHLSAQGGETTKNGGFSYKVASPTISSVTPDTYTVGDGATKARVTIKGFILSTTSKVYVDINRNGQADSGETCTSLRVTNDTTIDCIMPLTAAAGTYDVYAVTDKGTASKSKAFTYVRRPASSNPTMIKASPRTVPEQGSPVMFTGTGFSGVTEVNFGSEDLQCTNLIIYSDTALSCTSPNMFAGFPDIHLINYDGTDHLIEEHVITVSSLSDIDPQVAVVSPNLVLTNANVELTLGGIGLNKMSSVRIGDYDCSINNINSDGTLATCTIRATYADPSPDVVVNGQYTFSGLVTISD